MINKINYLKNWFRTSYSDLYNKMTECDHGYNGNVNPYHEEGSVWKHTEMVLDSLDTNVSDNVLIAALLHDVGKIFVRQIEDNKVYFRNHASRSVFESINIINHIYDIDRFVNIDIVKILNLIALHYIFFNYTENQTIKSAKKIAKKLYKYNIDFFDDLIALVKADQEGRITSVKKEISDEFFDMIRNEINVLLDTFIYQESKNSIIFTVGIPYSGKSSLFKNNVKKTIISRDEILMKNFPNNTYNDAWKLADHDDINKQFDNILKKSINNSEDIVIDMTNMSKKSRNKKLNFVPKNYKKIAYVFYTGLNTIKDRMASRADKYIGWSVMENMMNSYNVPLYDEFDEIYFYITV